MTYIKKTAVFLFFFLFSCFSAFAQVYDISLSAEEEFSITEPKAEHFILSEGLSIVEELSEDGKRIGFVLKPSSAGKTSAIVEFADGSKDFYRITVQPYALSEKMENLYSSLSEEWPEDLSEERKETVKTALSGVGNISYAAEDNGLYGKDFPEELSSFEFVAWVYCHSGTETPAPEEARAVPYEDLLPGDVGFKAEERTCCGIYAGKVNARDIWVCCKDEPEAGVAVTDKEVPFTDFFCCIFENEAGEPEEDELL